MSGHWPALNPDQNPIPERSFHAKKEKPLAWSCVGKTVRWGAAAKWDPRERRRTDQHRASLRGTPFPRLADGASLTRHRPCTRRRGRPVWASGRGRARPRRQMGRRGCGLATSPRWLPPPQLCTGGRGQRSGLGNVPHGRASLRTRPAPLAGIWPRRPPPPPPLETQQERAGYHGGCSRRASI